MRGKWYCNLVGRQICNRRKVWKFILTRGHLSVGSTLRVTFGLHEWNRRALRRVTSTSSYTLSVFSVLWTCDRHGTGPWLPLFPWTLTVKRFSSRRVSQVVGSTWVSYVVWVFNTSNVGCTRFLFRTSRVVTQKGRGCTWHFLTEGSWCQILTLTRVWVDIHWLREIIPLSVDWSSNSLTWHLARTLDPGYSQTTDTDDSLSRTEEYMIEWKLMMTPLRSV